jgi:hypothetical protein
VLYLQSELGIGPLGHRRALLDAVVTLSRQAEDAGPRVQPYPTGNFRIEETVSYSSVVN